MIFVYRNLDATNRMFDYSSFSYSKVWMTFASIATSSASKLAPIWFEFFEG